MGAALRQIRDQQRALEGKHKDKVTKLKIRADALTREFDLS